MRDGIDDVRYLQALDRAISAADARLTEADPSPGLAEALDRARQARQECYDSIAGQWFRYMGRLSPGDLARVRRRLADAALTLDRLVR